MRWLAVGMLSCCILGAAVPTPKACVECHDVDLAKFAKTPHVSMACTGCHSDITRLPHGDPPKPVDCGDCHPDEMKAYDGSVHGVAHLQGMDAAAICTSCHGPAHELLPVGDPASGVAKKNLADTCGACHSDPEFMARHRIPFAMPVAAYKNSVHGKAVASGNTAAPSCPDCHGSHDILSATNPKARVNRVNVVGTCGACHGAVKAAYVQSVHGTAVAAGSPDAPTCTDCHGEHTILAPTDAGALVNPARVSTAVCGHCHADARLVKRYNLPTNSLTTIENSFHGLASQGGQVTVANCGSCHGVHNILPASDPRSTINPRNLARTCGQCHAGVGSELIGAKIHVQISGSEHPLVRLIRLSYLFLIPITIGFMLLHNGLDFLSKLRRRRSRHESGKVLPRMGLLFRIPHWLVMVSFTTLVLTGFALKFPDSAWVKALGGFEPTSSFRPVVHRIAAIVLTVATLFHLGHMALLRSNHRVLRELVPTWQDPKDLIHMLGYNLGLTRRRPTFGMFSYAEKIEYWAFMWGTVVMASTGSMLWAENWTMRHFPTWVLDAATAAHWYEAILATLSILIWHWYLVIFDPDVYPMEMAWLTGHASADHMRETRPEYYQQTLESLGKDPEGQGRPEDGS